MLVCTLDSACITSVQNDGHPKTSFVANMYKVHGTEYLEYETQSAAGLPENNCFHQNVPTEWSISDSLVCVFSYAQCWECHSVKVTNYSN